ncbi:MAG TPA: DEAD/DEAH box helicase [Polyangiales bacterium]|nr:DEAD/DEAH box helicase [Polyangiales bacterium]
MQFSDFGLSQPVLRAIGEEGYDTPTPIQQQAIPHVLQGRDLLGCAQTGTGKTAAFALPIIERLAAKRTPRVAKKARVLVLSPTRELAAQIAESFDSYGRHSDIKTAVIFGGVNQTRQVELLARGVDVLVATPGRLLDLLNQKAVTLSALEVFVLDEADRMLDMGFIHDVRKIAALVPAVRQTLLFSATMPNDIRQLAAKLLNDPVEVAVAPVSSTAEKIDQAIYFVEKGDKRSLLAWILEDAQIDRVLVFTRTKHGANRVAEFLEKKNISAAAIHGNKSQNARERALDGFKSGKVRALIATDIAARGIDIDSLAYVINFDLPNVPEAYVHRIGRTGRAGAAGQALSFCEEEERPYLADIERLIRINLEAVTKHPFPSPLGIPAKTDLDKRGGSQTPKGGFGARRSGGSGHSPRSGSGQPRSQDRRHSEARGGERRQDSRGGEARTQQRPAAQGQRPAQQGQRPAAQQAQRPAAAQQRPVVQQQAQRPAAQGEPRRQDRAPQDRERSAQAPRREETGRHETHRSDARRTADERVRPVGSR